MFTKYFTTNKLNSFILTIKDFRKFLFNGLN